jgi:hypothetical protein
MSRSPRAWLLAWFHAAAACIISCSARICGRGTKGGQGCALWPCPALPCPAPRRVTPWPEAARQPGGGGGALCLVLAPGPLLLHTVPRLMQPQPTPEHPSSSSPLMVQHRPPPSLAPVPQHCPPPSPAPTSSSDSSCWPPAPPSSSSSIMGLPPSSRMRLPSSSTTCVRECGARVGACWRQCVRAGRGWARAGAREVGGRAAPVRGLLASRRGWRRARPIEAAGRPLSWGHWGRTCPSSLTYTSSSPSASSICRGSGGSWWRRGVCHHPGESPGTWAGAAPPPAVGGTASQPACRLPAPVST